MDTIGPLSQTYRPTFRITADASHSSPQGLPRRRRRQRRVRRDGGMEPDPPGHQRGDARRGRRSSTAASTGRTSAHGKRASGRRTARRSRSSSSTRRSSRTSRLKGKPFELIRVWGHGGKTNVWGRVSLRYSDLDFKGADEGRLGDSLADRIQGRRAVLRQGRSADRRLRRRRRLGLAAGQQVLHAAAGDAMQRAPAEEGVRVDGHPRRRRAAGEQDAAARTAIRRATTAATAARAATWARRSARRITCCRAR